MLASREKRVHVLKSIPTDCRFNADDGPHDVKTIKGRHQSSDGLRKAPECLVYVVARRSWSCCHSLGFLFAPIRLIGQSLIWHVGQDENISRELYGRFPYVRLVDNETFRELYNQD
jgi:hypothetical protein